MDLILRTTISAVEIGNTEVVLDRIRGKTQLGIRKVLPTLADLQEITGL